MKNYLLFNFLFLFGAAYSQVIPLPSALSDYGKAIMAWEQFVEPQQAAYITTPPPYPVRHMAEWEELQALAITWHTYTEILTQIVLHAALEVKVVIFCNDEAVKSTAQIGLQVAGANMANVEFVITPNDKVWIRDYGPNCVYKNDVEALNFIDWVYNRNDRPNDDAMPASAAAHFGVPLFSTTENPERLVNTGGNFMSDGLGTAFASKLVLTENGLGNNFGAGPHTELEIDEIMEDYMGIKRYIKMEILPFDIIHHIDMHMRLLDEETLLIGQYPPGIADGPQIEANLTYVTDNFNSYYGTPYKVVRVIQPPNFNGLYPPIGHYRTYTNSVFVNKTILVPIYEEQYDTTALRIYREQFPGYKVVGINCNDIISASGALHCITKEIGVTDPLWITHQRHPDVVENNLYTGGYTISAGIKHKSGIAGATTYFTTDTASAYMPLPMQPTGNPNEWTCTIPHQDNGSTIFYYISASSNTAKTTVRPLAAPEGYYRFHVDQFVSSAVEPKEAAIKSIYPNPASGITVIPISTTNPIQASIELIDVLGQHVSTIFAGQLQHGETRHYLDAAQLPTGIYFVRLQTATGISSQKVVVR
ncbi:MAG: agmatine deiminase family protein [Saprospiraceae bacterium]|nr:agmatine deiminase family protein [Saprospiraceae bacterium]